MLGSVLEGLSTAAAGGDTDIVSRNEYVSTSTTSLKLAKMYFYYNGLNLLLDIRTATSLPLTKCTVDKIFLRTNQSNDDKSTGQL